MCNSNRKFYSSHCVITAPLKNNIMSTNDKTNDLPDDRADDAQPPPNSEPETTAKPTESVAEVTTAGTQVSQFSLTPQSLTQLLDRINNSNDERFYSTQNSPDASDNDDSAISGVQNADVVATSSSQTTLSVNTSVSNSQATKKRKKTASDSSLHENLSNPELKKFIDLISNDPSIGNSIIDHLRSIHNEDFLSRDTALKMAAS